MARVMIVDDNHSVRQLISILISEAGHEVVFEAKNGLEALNAYYKTDPDLIIVDFQMPIMDGVTLIKEISKENPNVNIVLCTGSLEENGINSVIGKDIPILRKPFDPAELIETVFHVLNFRTESNGCAPVYHERENGCDFHKL